MTHPTISPDQLRWQISPILFLVLDAAENAVVEVLGQRAIVPSVKDLAEAVRQLQVQQGPAQQHPAAAPLMAATIAGYAAQARADLVRQHIADAAFNHLLREDVINRDPHVLSEDIADAAMNGMADMFKQAVVSAAAQIFGELADHPDWRDLLGVRAMTEIGDQALADLSGRAAQLLEFTQGVAGMGDAEPGSDAAETLTGLIGDARRLLRIPDPDGEHVNIENWASSGDEPAPKFWWNDHRNANGVWCRCSHLPVSDKLAASDDKRCLHECPDSTIEPIPPAGPLSAPISPNGIGPAHDTGAE